MVVDRQKIIDLVAVRHGLHLSKDDPILVTVSLAEEIWREVGPQLKAQVLLSIEDAGMRWSAELRGAAGVLDGLSVKTQESLRQALQLVAQSVRDDLAEISQTIHAEVAGSVKASTEGLNQSLSRLVGEIRQAADQAARARRGAFLAAAVAGAMTTGGILVLCLPIIIRLL